MDESLSTALEHAGRIGANRRALVALIKDAEIRWWGGNIDRWVPDVTQLSSQAALDNYQKLVNDFKAGRKPKGHAVMVYKDGTFASVMLGIKSKSEADEYMADTLAIVQVRTPMVWLKA